MSRVYVLNGPNLNRLGTREPEVYGHATFSDLVDLCVSTGESLGLDVEVRTWPLPASHALRTAWSAWGHPAAERLLLELKGKFADALPVTAVAPSDSQHDILNALLARGGAEILRALEAS